MLYLWAAKGTLYELHFSVNDQQTVKFIATKGFCADRVVHCIFEAHGY